MKNIYTLEHNETGTILGGQFYLSIEEIEAHFTWLLTNFPNNHEVDNLVNNYNLIEYTITDGKCLDLKEYVNNARKRAM